jgi:hypothetical protein
MRRPKLIEFRLKACCVGKPDASEGSQAKARRYRDQLADGLRRRLMLPEAGATKRQDAVRKGEIAVAVDRLARVCHDLFVPVGQQAG